ncbi:MAG: hypothetical protein ABIJ10_05565 [Candidatus Micrarchaeota archaeon]
MSSDTVKETLKVISKIAVLITLGILWVSPFFVDVIGSWPQNWALTTLATNIIFIIVCHAEDNNIIDYIFQFIKLATEFIKSLTGNSKDERPSQNENQQKQEPKHPEESKKSEEGLIYQDKYYVEEITLPKNVCSVNDLSNKKRGDIVRIKTDISIFSRAVWDKKLALSAQLYNKIDVNAQPIQEQFFIGKHKSKASSDKIVFHKTELVIEIEKIYKRDEEYKIDGHLIQAKENRNTYDYQEEINSFISESEKLHRYLRATSVDFIGSATRRIPYQNFEKNGITAFEIIQNDNLKNKFYEIVEWLRKYDDKIVGKSTKQKKEKVYLHTCINGITFDTLIKEMEKFIRDVKFEIRYNVKKVEKNEPTRPQLEEGVFYQDANYIGNVSLPKETTPLNKLLHGDTDRTVKIILTDFLIIKSPKDGNIRILKNITKEHKLLISGIIEKFFLREYKSKIEGNQRPFKVKKAEMIIKIERIEISGAEARLIQAKEV